MALSHITDGTLVDAVDWNALVDAINANSNYGTPDSGWVNITVGTGYTAATDTPQARQVGDTLRLRGTIQASSGNLTGTAAIGTIPTSITAPTVQIVYAAAGASGGVPMRVVIGTDRSITMTAPLTGTSTYVNLTALLPLT